MDCCFLLFLIDFTQYSFLVLPFFSLYQKKFTLKTVNVTLCLLNCLNVLRTLFFFLKGLFSWILCPFLCNLHINHWHFWGPRLDTPALMGAAQYKCYRLNFKRVKLYGVTVGVVTLCLLVISHLDYSITGCVWTNPDTKWHNRWT